MVEVDSFHLVGSAVPTLHTTPYSEYIPVYTVQFEDCAFSRTYFPYKESVASTRESARSADAGCSIASPSTISLAPINQGFSTRGSQQGVLNEGFSTRGSQQEILISGENHIK